jgi:hypothetical protein
MYRKVRPDWYTTEITKKKNESWTLQDLILVYTMRVKNNMATDEIIEALKKRGKKADKISVYNLTRQSKKALLGKCFKCGEDLTPQEMQSKKMGRILFLCTSCREEASQMKKKRRELFLKQGFCGVCGKRKALPGHTSCKKCLSSVNRRRIIQGICGTCGKNPIDSPRSIHQCSTCLEKNNIKSKIKSRGVSYGE